MTIIIPSLDRAAQLLCLLDSLNKFIDEPYQVKVLYKFSSIDYLRGYSLVAGQYPNIDWLVEDDFQENWLTLLRDSEDIVMLATDDCVLFKECEKLSKIDWTDLHCFSLRLGLNTIVQDYLKGSLQTPLQKYGYKNINNLIRWKFKQHSYISNYGYAFSLDLTLYKKEKLLHYMDGLKFDCPRSLEYNLTIKPKLRESLPMYMCSQNKSCGFVNTVNCVQKNGQLPAGVLYYYSLEELNKKLLNREKISIKSFENLNLQSSHFETPLIFEKF